MGLYNRFCKRFFAAVIIRLTAQSDSRAPLSPMCNLSPFSTPAASRPGWTQTVEVIEETVRSLDVL